MNEEIKLANRAIFDFVCEHFKTDKASFFDKTNQEKQEELKQLLLNRFVYCCKPYDPEYQRLNMAQFFYEADRYLLIEGTTIPRPLMSAFNVIEGERELTVKSMWSSLGLMLLDDLKRKPDIHQGGYLSGCNASGHHDGLLLLAILHRQLFGMDLNKAARDYPLTWDDWIHYMTRRFELLAYALQDTKLGLQRQLWVQIFSSVLDTISTTECKRYDKFVYQIFFNIVNSFKTAVFTGADYKAFEVPPTIVKANPALTQAQSDVAIMSVLQTLLQAPLTELKQALILPPAIVVSPPALKDKSVLTVVTPTQMQDARQKTAAIAKESGWKTCLKMTHAVETYGSINACVEDEKPRISHCYSSLYTHVPKSMQLKPNAVNDDCYACAIL